MSKNRVQFQKGFSLAGFMEHYGTEARCAEALSKARWPPGFRCPACGGSRHSVVRIRNLYQCTRRHHQASLTAGTLFEQTKLPLATWFLAIHLVTQARAGLSALALKRQLGISYNTAWGGERHGGKRGRGSENKTPFVAAVALNEDRHPVAMNLQVVKGFRSDEAASTGGPTCRR